MNYRKLVNEARKILKSIDTSQDRVVKLALKSTTIKRGREIGSQDKFYTMRDFAKDIGVKYSTLMSWHSRLSQVTSKLSVAPTIQDKGAINRTLKRVTADTSPSKVEKIFLEEKARNQSDLKFQSYLEALGRMQFFICSEADLRQVNKKDLDDFYRVIMKIYLKLADYYKKKTRRVKSGSSRGLQQ